MIPESLVWGGTSSVFFAPAQAVAAAEPGHQHRDREPRPHVVKATNTLLARQVLVRDEPDLRGLVVDDPQVRVNGDAGSGRASAQSRPPGEVLPVSRPVSAFTSVQTIVRPWRRDTQMVSARCPADGTRGLGLG